MHIFIVCSPLSTFRKTSMEQIRYQFLFPTTILCFALLRISAVLLKLTNCMNFIKSHSTHSQTCLSYVLLFELSVLECIKDRDFIPLSHQQCLSVSYSPLCDSQLFIVPSRWSLIRTTMSLGLDHWSCSKVKITETRKKLWTWLQLVSEAIDSHLAML